MTEWTVAPRADLPGGARDRNADRNALGQAQSLAHVRECETGLRTPSEGPRGDLTNRWAHAGGGSKGAGR